MPKKQHKNKLFCREKGFSLTPELEVKLERIASQRQCSQSAVVRLLIFEYPLEEVSQSE